MLSSGDPPQPPPSAGELSVLRAMNPFNKRGLHDDGFGDQTAEFIARRDVEP